MSKKGQSADYPKTFRQYRNEWMGEGKSDNINYCMPVNIGIIAQDFATFDKVQMKAAVDKILKSLGRWFGKFKVKNKTPSHNHLCLMIREGDTLAGFIAGYLKEICNANVISASEQDIKQYCWMTVAAWDGIPSQTGVYQTIKDILSTKISVGENYRLKFPDNRPIIQIVLPDGSGTPSVIDYTVREIYPHMLETINISDPWFGREKYQPQSRSDKRKDSKRRNFIANAAKLKKFNKKISGFSRKIDSQTENIYDLLPWQHFHEKYTKKFKVPDHANTANLREIFYYVFSMKAQKSEDRQGMALLLLAAAGLISFAVYSDAPLSGLESVKLFFFGMFVVCMVLAYLIYIFRVLVSGSHKTYLEFRALAEGMRVQCYWYAAGLNQSVGEKYTVKFQKDMQWAKQAFNAWFVSDYLEYEFTGNANSVLKPDPDKNPSLFLKRNKMVKAEWLGTLMHSTDSKPPQRTVLPDELKIYKDCPYAGNEDFEKELNNLKKSLGREDKLMPGGQYGYFYKTTRNWGKKDRTGKIKTRISFGLWIICSLLLVFFVLTQSPLEDLFVCLMGISATIPIVVTGWASIKAYGELASKYSYCELLAEKALQDYEAAEKEIRGGALVKQTLTIFEQYGVEALEENAEWLMIKNDREPTVPNG